MNLFTDAYVLGQIMGDGADDKPLSKAPEKFCSKCEHSEDEHDQEGCAHEDGILRVKHCPCKQMSFSDVVTFADVAVPEKCLKRMGYA